MHVIQACVHVRVIKPSSSPSQQEEEEEGLVSPFDDPSQRCYSSIAVKC